jgi:hypothetical protein
MQAAIAQGPKILGFGLVVVGLAPLVMIAIGSVEMFFEMESDRPAVVTGAARRGTPCRQ